MKVSYQPKRIEVEVTYNPDAIHQFHDIIASCKVANVKLKGVSCGYRAYLSIMNAPRDCASVEVEVDVDYPCWIEGIPIYLSPHAPLDDMQPLLECDGLKLTGILK